MRITPSDLDWWVEKAPTLRWIYAKTYAATAPHFYVVLGTTEGMTMEDFVRASHVLFTFGEPRRFWAATDLYLSSPDQSVRWWTCDKANVDSTVLINMVDFKDNYGTQDAAATETGVFTFYDGIAAEYDREHRKVTPEDQRDLWRLVDEVTRSRAVPVLDIGCGTGSLLDAKVCRVEDYTGIDPSRGMLNGLVLKHPQVRNLYPMVADEALPQFTERQFGLVTALRGSASYLTPDVIESLPSLTSGHVILSHYAPGRLPDYYADGEGPEHADAARKATAELFKEFTGTRFLGDRFEVTVLNVNGRR